MSESLAVFDPGATRYVDQITRYTYRVRDGEAIVLAVAVVEPDGKAKSLVNAKADFVALDADGVAVITKTSTGVGGGIVFVDNCVEVTIDPADWAPLRAGVDRLVDVYLTYHLRLTDAAAQPADLQEGSIELVWSPFV